MVVHCCFVFGQSQSRSCLSGWWIGTTLMLIYNIRWICSPSIYSFGNWSSRSVIGNRMHCGGQLSFSSKHLYVCSWHWSRSFNTTFSSVISQFNFISPLCGFVRSVTCKWVRTILKSIHRILLFVWLHSLSFVNHLVSHVFIREDTYVKIFHQTLRQLAVQRIQVVNTIHENMKRVVNFTSLVSVIFTCTIWWSYSLRTRWHLWRRHSGSCVDRSSASRLAMWAWLFSEGFGSNIPCPVYHCPWWCFLPTLSSLMLLCSNTRRILSKEHLSTNDRVETTSTYRFSPVVIHCSKSFLR